MMVDVVGGDRNTGREVDDTRVGRPLGRTPRHRYRPEAVSDRHAEPTGRTSECAVLLVQADRSPDLHNPVKAPVVPRLRTAILMEVLQR